MGTNAMMTGQNQMVGALGATQLNPMGQNQMMNPNNPMAMNMNQPGMFNQNMGTWCRVRMGAVRTFTQQQSQQQMNMMNNQIQAGFPGRLTTKGSKESYIRTDIFLWSGPSPASLANRIAIITLIIII